MCSTGRQPPEDRRLPVVRIGLFLSSRFCLTRDPVLPDPAPAARFFIGGSQTARTCEREPQHGCKDTLPLPGRSTSMRSGVVEVCGRKDFAAFYIFSGDACVKPFDQF